MRLWIALTLLALNTAAQVPAPQPAVQSTDAEKKLGSIEGKVVNAITGERFGKRISS
ncbi:MAG TPA: hypothetical protein VH681_10910 [Nitrospiraceae bacterium]|jgi:hypothetical protein